MSLSDLTLISLKPVYRLKNIHMFLFTKIIVKIIYVYLIV